MGKTSRRDGTEKPPHGSVALTEIYHVDAAIASLTVCDERNDNLLARSVFHPTPFSRPFPLLLTARAATE